MPTGQREHRRARPLEAQPARLVNGTRAGLTCGESPATGAPSRRVDRLSRLEFFLPLLGLGVLLVLPVWMFLVPLNDRGEVEWGTSSALFGAAALLCTGRLCALMLDGRPRWLTIGFWMFSYVWIAVVGLVQALAGSDPLHVTLTRREADAQALLVLVGLVAFELGSRLRSGHARPVALVTRSIVSARVVLLGWVVVAVAPALVHLLGGPTALVSNREAVEDQLKASGLYSDATNAGGGIITALANVLPLLALLSFLAMWIRDRRFRLRLSNRLLLIALLVVNLLLNNPISNSRYWAFTVILSLFYLVGISRHRNVITAFVVVFTVSGLSLFPYLDHFRYSEETERAYNLPANPYDDPLDYILNKTDYGSVTDVGVAIRHVAVDGPGYGRQLAGTVLFWVPRSVWADKPENTSTVLADTIGFPNRNLDSPLWAEGYVDFGWPGAMVLLAAAGFLARRLDEAFAGCTELRGRVPLGLVLIPVLAGYEFILIRGSLLQAMARLVVVVVVAFALSRPTRSEGLETERLSS